jgi:hypothetical protein
MNLVGNNKHNGTYLAVAASSNQLPQQFAFNDSTKTDQRFYPIEM